MRIHRLCAALRSYYVLLAGDTVMDFCLPVHSIGTNMITLDDFIRQHIRSLNICHNSYVHAPGFSTCYVRMGPRFLDVVRHPVLDFANIAVRQPGHGIFTRLVERLRLTYPELCIYVECVHNPRFATYLIEQLEFTQHSLHELSYYLLATSE